MPMSQGDLLQGDSMRKLDALTPQLAHNAPERQRTAHRTAGGDSNTMPVYLLGEPEKRRDNDKKRKKEKIHQRK